MRSAIWCLRPNAFPGPSGLDGWRVPKPSAPRGINVFVQAAVRLFTSDDWATLANAAYRDIYDAPAAFDVAFAGLYWGLRNGNTGKLPSRNVAWLTLKVMSAAPAHLRLFQPSAKFNPLHAMPKRQISSGKGRFGYPVSFPRGARLEESLRATLDHNFRKRTPEPVDWAGLFHGLDQLLGAKNPDRRKHMFIQIHMLQSMPPGNLNRDDTGQPKKCVFGHVTRARMGSQCLKRNIRHSRHFKEAFGDALADRTTYLPRMVADELKKLDSTISDDGVCERSRRPP